MHILSPKEIVQELHRPPRVPPPHTARAASFFPPGWAPWTPSRAPACLRVPLSSLTDFSSPPIFPEGLLSFSSDINKPRREDETQKQRSGREVSGGHLMRAGAPGPLRLRHVARKRTADAIGKRPSPASHSVGRTGSQSIKGEGGSFRL